MTDRTGDRMINYHLVGVDQMEASKLRRKLDPIEPWDNAKSERVKPVIAYIANSFGVDIVPSEPRWENSIYPLYYLYAGKNRVNTNAIYAKMRDDYIALFPGLDRTCSTDQLTAFIGDIANTEIDLLIEDVDYFIFVEAKDPPDGKSAIFQKRHGVHQLVLQYAEGLFLARKIKNGSF